MSELNRKCAVYRAFDKLDNLLYVGISYDPNERMKSHKCYSKWFELMNRIELTWFKCRQDAANYEVKAIRNELPDYNSVNTKTIYQSEHFVRLGMTQGMKADVERWRVGQLEKTGSVPSFSEALRVLVNKGLVADE